MVPLNTPSKILTLFLHPPILRPFSITLQARWLKLSKMTGCIPLCTVRFSSKPIPTNPQLIQNQSKSEITRSFTFVEKTSEEANWARNWSSAFYLDVKTSSYIHQTEFYACKQILNCIPRANLFTYFHKKIQLKNLFNRFYVSQERIQINIKSQDHKPHFCDR